MTEKIQRPLEYYNITVEEIGNTVRIYHQEDNNDNIAAVCERLNGFIEQGYRFTKFELGGDMIGWKYIDMVLEKPTEEL